MDHPEAYAIPLTEDEHKKTEDIMEQIQALVKTLPPRVEYNITVGGHHIHEGNAGYLLMTAGELIARLCRNVVEQVGEVGALSVLPLVMVQTHIMNIVGRTALDVAKKYGMECDEPEGEPPTRARKMAGMGFHTDGDANA